MKSICRNTILLALLFVSSAVICQERDTLCQKNVDSLTLVNKELEGQVKKLEQQLERLEEKQKFYEEKESFYKVEMMRDLRETNEQLLTEKEKYQRMTDSLRNSLIEAEKTIIRNNEELKYTQQRARDAEAKVNAATNKKKKVCAIQGIAMKTFRTHKWSIAPYNI